MRIRSIKPDFFLDEELASRPPLERLLFESLWCQADRSGRLEDKPGKIKAQALPYDDCDVDSMLSNLHDADYIQRYEVNGRKYIQVRTFERHQRPNAREAHSTIPDPPVRETLARESTRTHVHARGEGKGREIEGKGKGTEASTESTAALPPRSLSKASKAEYQRLVDQPEIRELGEYWCRHMGGGLVLGLLRAISDMFKGAYSADVGRAAIDALVLAQERPELFDPRGTARWCLGHNQAPDYVLRPGIVEKLAVEHEAARRRLDVAAALPASVPRQLRERDDVPATADQIAAARAGRGAA